MIRLPAPLRDALVKAIVAGIDEVIVATSADSDGGRRITRAERKRIARAAYEAALKLPAVEDEPAL